MSDQVHTQDVTLDSSREHFFVAQRAHERLAAQLKVFVGALEQQTPDDGWLEQVQAEAAKLVTFLDNQREQWMQISTGIDSYVESVKELADTMAINGEVLLQPCQFRLQHRAVMPCSTCNTQSGATLVQIFSSLSKFQLMPALGCVR